jgi:ribosomal protein S18 acetylase RimI-like enzyme
MVRAAVERLRQYGASEVILATNFDNAAAFKAYESVGFGRRCWESRRTL